MSLPVLVSGHGVDVVLIHGMTFSARSWDPVVEALGPGFRCIRPDLPGHGHAPAAARGLTVAGVLDAVTVTLSQLRVEQPLMIGHSFGSLMVAGYAARAPVRAVVTVDQPFELSGFAATVAQWREDLRSAEGRLRFAEWVEAIMSIPENLPPEPLERVERVRSRSPDAIAPYFRHLAERPDAVLELIDATLHRVSAPFLALHAADPGSAYRAWLTERVPQTQIEVWPQGGHCLHLAAPARFARRCRQLLELRSRPKAIAPGT